MLNFRGVIKGLLDVGWNSWNSVDIGDRPTTVPISGSEFQGGWGGSTWWILCVKQQQFEMGNLNKWVCHRWLYITIIIPETHSTKCRHLKNCPANHPKNDAHSKKPWSGCVFHSIPTKKLHQQANKVHPISGTFRDPQGHGTLYRWHTIPIPLPFLNP